MNVPFLDALVDSVDHLQYIDLDLYGNTAINNMYCVVKMTFLRSDVL